MEENRKLNWHCRSVLENSFLNALYLKERNFTTCSNTDDSGFNKNRICRESVCGGTLLYKKDWSSIEIYAEQANEEYNKNIRISLKQKPENLGKGMKRSVLELSDSQKQHCGKKCEHLKNCYELVESSKESSIDL
ncbi:MAG: hypothetical protein ACLUIQ_01395 [Dialister invisus]